MNQKINILYICETPRYGVGRHLMDLSDYMISMGHNICIIWSRERSSKEFRNWLECNKNKIISLELKMRRQIGFRDLKIIWQINSFLKSGSFNPDIIHGHSSKGGAYSAIIALKYMAISVYSPHAFAFISKFRNIFFIDYKWLIEFFLSRKRNIIATSMSEKALAETLQPRNIEYIPNGIELKNSLELIPSTDQNYKISFVGRLEEQKDPLLFVKIASNILKSNKLVEFNIFGEGNLLIDVKNQIKKLNLSKKVFTHGEKPLKYIFENTDILICTSKYEGFPYLFIQCISNGIPIVTTQVGGAHEVTDAGEVGLIYQKNNLRPVEDFVKYFSSNPGAFQKLKKATLKHSRKFCKDKMSKSTLLAYGKFLKVTL